MQRLLAHSNWIALAVGLLSATGFAPLGLWPVLLVCFAVWLLLVARAPTLRSALFTSWLFGVGHFTVGNNWIQHAFDFQEKMPPVLGYFAVVALALYLAIYPMLAGGLVWRYARRGPRIGADFILIAGAAWSLTEWLRGTMFTGYAWDPVGTAWLPLIGVARLSSWIGTYALSGLTIVVAGALMLLIHRQWRPAAVCASIITVAALTGLSSPAARPIAPGAPHVRVVQPNIGQETAHDPDYNERLFARLLELTGNPDPDHPRLVLWPEGAVNYFVESGYPPQYYYQADPAVVRTRIAATLGPRDTALVGGTSLFFARDGQLTAAGNSIFAVDPRARLGRERYDKAHLVPYGEYLPMRTLLAPLGLARLVMGEVDFDPGPGPETMPVPGFGRIGMQICYEIIFSGEVVDQANRPSLLFNPSNDGWFGTWGPPQHLAQARMRAIEEGLPILRSTPNGISAVIAADGHLLASIPHGQSGVIDLPLPTALPPTLFARIGNWMLFIVAGLLVIGAVALRRVTR